MARHTPNNKKHIKSPIPTIDIVEDETLSPDDVVQELVRLAEEFPERRITRDFFRKNSNILESQWTQYFGTFAEYLRAADLNSSRYANKIANRTAQHASVDKLRELDGQRREYSNLYPKDTASRWKTMVAGSDFHDIECDPFFLRVFTETCRVIQPEVICLAGDIFDCPEFGKYNVDPREWDVVGRVKGGLDIIAGLRAASQNSQIDLIEGNHEARIIRHLVETNPTMQAMLSDLHGMDIRRFLKLDEYEVNYFARGNLYTFTDAQTKREVNDNFKIYWNSVVAHHFPEGRKLGKPGFNGHHHKHVVWSEYNLTHGSYEWHQMGAGHVRNASYCNGRKWNNGFLIINVDTHYGYVNFEYVSVGATMATSGGNFFYRTEEEVYPALAFEMEQSKKY